MKQHEPSVTITLETLPDLLSKSVSPSIGIESIEELKKLAKEGRLFLKIENQKFKLTHE